jgi:hypothetical protein
MLVLAAGCGISVDASIVRLSCADGRCPSGYNCDEGFCIRVGSTTSCGDGVVDQLAAEDCDPPDGEGGACTSKCRFARCGDGEVRTGIEDCEPALDTDCPESCTFCAGVEAAGHCFIAQGAATLSGAIDLCEDIPGAHLLTVDSEDENQVGRSQGEPAWLWLESATRWHTGADVSFASWAGGEPSYQGADFAADVGTDGLWRTFGHTGEERQVVCELEGWFFRPEDNHGYIIDWRMQGFVLANSKCPDLGGERAIVETNPERVFLAATLPEGKYHVTTADGGCELLVVYDGMIIVEVDQCAVTDARTLCEHG